MDQTSRPLLPGTRYRKQELGFNGSPVINKELCALLYLSERHGKILFVPMCYDQVHVKTQETAAVLAFDAPLEDVGYYARRALLQFEVKPWGGHPQPRPRTEWPIFKMSGAKTLREFDRDFMRLHLETTVGTLRISEVRSHSEDPKDDLHLTAYFAETRGDVELGDLIMELYHRARYLQSCPKRSNRMIMGT